MPLKESTKLLPLSKDEEALKKLEEKDKGEEHEQAQYGLKKKVTKTMN